MSLERSDLYFGPTHQPVGFTSAAVAQFDGSAEPVVRELIQNSLDAIHKAGRHQGEVNFLVREVEREQLPGLQSYERALESALAERKRWNAGKPSHDEKMVVKRITEMIRKPVFPILVCIDNGHGLNGRRMDALLTPGNTDKGDAGAGSFGLGHHAAFGASSLRYVLYGATFRSDVDRLGKISSGHAILATHFSSVDGVRAADGYWFKIGQGQLAFDGNHDAYPSDPPSLLDPHLESLSDTGTVVCIAGFNEFHREEDDPTVVDLISRVAASNFSDAIHAGDLAITVRDERSGAFDRVNWMSLDRILARYSHNKRAEKYGQINGAIAYSAWRTMYIGSAIPWSGGGEIYWRHTHEPTRVGRQVHIFRKGMWITSRAPGLMASDFSNTWPFDAVVALDDGPLETLVRSAEGPEHRGIDRRRLDNEQKREFRELIADVAERLRLAVGVRDDNEEYTPPGFATLSGHVIRTAEPVRRPRLPAGGGQTGERVESGQGDTDAERRRTRRRGTPRPGSVPRYRTALYADPQTAQIKAQVQYDEEVGSQAEIGVRVRVVSGADGTCEQPLPDTFLPLLAVSDDKGTRTKAETTAGSLELVIPATPGLQTLSVTLTSRPPNPQLLELDLVKRRTLRSHEDERDGG